MGEQAIYSLYVDWDNDGYFDGPGEDCSADFVSASIGRGFSDPLARVAAVGRASIVLLNVNRQYSPPLNANVLPRRAVLVQMTYGGLTGTRFAGWIERIIPSSGEYEDRRITLECVDAMTLLDTEEGELALQTDVYADEVIGGAVDAVYAPAVTDYDSGISLFRVSADRWAWETPGQAVEEIKASQKVGEACLADWGLFFVAADGAPTFRNRWTTSLNAATVLTLDGTMQELTSSLSMTNVYNYVEVVCHPRSIGTVYEVLAAISQQDAPEIQAGASVTYVMPFRDPSNTKIRVGGLDPLLPVASTDYVATGDPGGEGTDETASVTAAAAFYGDHAEVTLTNGGAVSVYLQTLQIRGYAVRSREAITVAAFDPTSIAAYGRRKLRLDAALMNTQEQAQALADYLLDNYREPRLVVEGVGIQATVDAVRLAAVRDLELLQRVEISEYQTGISSFVGYVWNLQETIAGLEHRVSMGLVEAYDLGGTPFRIDISVLDGPDIFVY
jgi:hypothetical protein